MTPQSNTELLLSILVIAAATALTRFLPFWIFRAGRPVPPFIQRLQHLLPSAVIGLLVVYCLRNVHPLAGNHGLPELAALTAILLLHRWRQNTLLSIAGGTAVYMLLIQTLG